MRLGAPAFRVTGAWNPTNLSLSPVRAPHPQSRVETQTPPGYLYPNARQRQHPGPEPQAEKHTQTRTRLLRPAQSKLALRNGLGFVCLFVCFHVFTDPFEPSSSSIRIRIPVFHPDGVVGVERTKPLKQVSAVIVGLSPSSLSPHLPASSAGSRRPGLEALVGGGARTWYLTQASHLSLGASVPSPPGGGGGYLSWQKSGGEFVKQTVKRTPLPQRSGDSVPNQPTVGRKAN